ncbi:MAG: c-type cytochrome [Chitinophagales bacterium]
MRSSLALTLFTLILVFTVGVSDSLAYEPSTVVDINDASFLGRVEHGEELFKANCSACHAIGRKLVGPDLANVWERWGSEENLIAWIRNNQAFLKTGDAYANALYNEYNQSPMNLYLQFTDDDITSIIDYVRAKQANVYPIQEAATAVTGGEGVATPSKPSTGILWVLISFLVAMFLLLWRVSSKLEKINNEKEGIEIPESAPLINRLLNKKVMGAIAMIAIIFIGYNIGKGAVDLGRSQGYQPEQPIKFSHALHAGQNQIDCQYCHTGADKSKHANIPSVTVCMNCHKYVQQGPKYGTEEIAKIYAASGWDKEKADYTAPAEPIKWIKIHNLPDHVYFNHSQHVNVGKLDCQTCHGQVQEMEVVAQYAPLSMGWCVNCHRETEIKFKDSKYYETTFDRFHKEIEAQERSGVTVEDIGGTECQKCHY